MNTVEILPNLFFIERGYLNGNHLVYAGAPPQLIDTGYLGDLTTTLAHLEALDVDPGSVSRIVTTHCHCDHIGGHRHIQQQSGCRIVQHRMGKHFVDHRDGWSTWYRYYQQEAAFFDATDVVADGDTVVIGPHRFVVVHTPGHAADMIALYHPESRLLISSDALWEHDMAVITVRVEGSAAPFQALSSLNRVAALDVDVVYPGHGAPFTDVAAAVSRTRTRLQSFIDDPRKMGWDLLKKITVYTLLMRGPASEAGFFDGLMSTPWFPETVDLYFHGHYEKIYLDVVSSLVRKGAVVKRQGMLSTRVKP
jgi:hydroxyacylglutathione hydrolase